jgi:hypothetical protein
VLGLPFFFFLRQFLSFILWSWDYYPWIAKVVRLEVFGLDGRDRDRLGSFYSYS